MKNNSFKKISIILFFFMLILSSISQSTEFEFNGKEIDIVDNGKKILGYNGIEIFLNNKKQKITANKFEYNKIKKTLTIIGKIKFIDTSAEIEIFSDEAVYNEEKKSYKFEGNVEAKFLNKYFLTTEQVTYNKLKGLVSSNVATKINDNLDNQFTVSSFKYFRLLNQINANSVKYIDAQKNKYSLDEAVLDLNSSKILGKDIAINFNNNFFGNPKNSPRVKGTSIFADNNLSKISKGTFTTCKKSEKCPPWVISAEEVEHNKKKQTINYKNAWLKIYDKPVLYFPKFYHPDPTVKRQSGYLMPLYANSSSTGSSVHIPYYKVLGDHNDLTFKPRIYSNESLLIQNEYRHHTRKSKNIIDASFLKKQSLNFSKNQTTTHFFSNSIIDFDSSEFEEMTLEINLQNTSNNTYLKTYKIDSPLIDNNSTLNSYLNLYGSAEKTTFDISIDSYEDLTKKNESDKYTFIYPSFEVERQLESNFSLPGSFTLKTEGYQKKYNTNAYDGVLINDLLYSNTYFDRGIKNDFYALLKNVNSKGVNSTTFKNKEDTQLLPLASYKLSYPLSKKDLLSKNLFTPTASLNFSPTKNESLTKNDERIDINNVFSFNRIGASDSVESGLSIAVGGKYKKEYLKSDKYFSFNIAQNYRYRKNDDLPINGSIGEKSSDIFANIEYNLNESFNLKYDFNIKENLKKSNYDLISSKFSFDNFVTTFEYLDEKNSINKNSFISNKTSLLIDENNTLSFGTRKNRKINLTEYYDLIYQYTNDCLEAGIAYKKEYYNDSDLKSEEQIYFTLTVMPFGKIKSPRFK